MTRKNRGSCIAELRWMSCTKRNKSVLNDLIILVSQPKFLELCACVEMQTHTCFIPSRVDFFVLLVLLSGYLYFCDVSSGECSDTLQATLVTLKSASSGLLVRP